MSTSGTHLTLVSGSPPIPEAAPSALGVRSDDELVLLARGGLAEAFDTLVRRYQSRVLRMATRHLGTLAVAADAAQNTFLSVYRALPRYQPRDRFAAYLFRTVLNECRMMRRRHLVRERAFAFLSSAAMASEATGALEAPAASVEALILARERERDLAAAVAQLSAKLRDVVSLRYGADLGYEEIAETLQIPLGTVKRRLFDALGRLRCHMRDT